MNEANVEKTSHDDEYQFEEFDKFVLEEEAPAAASEQTSGASNEAISLAPKRDYRRMVIMGVILAIILVFAVRALLEHFNGVKIPKESPTLVAPQAESVSMHPPAPSISSQTVAMPAVAPAPAVATQADVDHLNSIITAQQQTMEQMQNSINSLQDALGNLNATLGDLSQKMTEAVDKANAKPVRPVVKPQVAPEPPKPVYTIRAMVPGRAWLQANDGQSITVVDGDTVPPYGTVQDIDVNGGQVVLSDGTLIGYNYNS